MVTPLLLFPCSVHSYRADLDPQTVWIKALPSYHASSKRACSESRCRLAEESPQGDATRGELNCSKSDDSICVVVSLQLTSSDAIFVLLFTAAGRTRDADEHEVLFHAVTLKFHFTQTTQTHTCSSLLLERNSSV